MIEFKAECGHTVRAKDEDAGRAVRCSYCGRAANVPDGQNKDGLDFLFTDLSAQSAPTVQPRMALPRKRGWFRRRARTSGEFNPFATVVKLCYAAGLLIVVIIVLRLWLFPLFRPGGFAERVIQNARLPATTTAQPTRGGESAPDRTSPGAKPGLIAREGRGGMYVNSTPPGAVVYCVESSRAPAKGRINLVEGGQQTLSLPHFLDLPDGEYVVEVVLRWSDTSLNKYQGFREFRRSIQGGGAEERRRRMLEYFIPDGAHEVFVDQADDVYLVRQYRGVQVRQQTSSGVRALFLPRLMAADGVSLAIDRLLNEYLPKTNAYVLDEENVRNELAFWGVKTTDEAFVMEALRRTGVFPYVTGGSAAQLLKIRVADGTLAVETLPDVRP